ncbi:amino acid-binding protein [Aureimonas sp. SA4125]|uniref:ABC transporter substrate-binding protein n=1 Tax=Aureimonas sp. SA4125 TaxID=2826993 RepID=UPI001CC503AC|nr:ABC transporter substrate-binding protein [Aureimonas sp. SA4125]BDA85051.1 amino acid-binding protein [Aureimonas sp. SA4125]
MNARSRLLAAAVLAASLSAAPDRVDAQEAPAVGGVRIGVAAPLSGSSALLGAQVRTGAAAAVAPDAVTLEVDTECAADAAARAARTLVAEKVDAVVGFLCTEALEAALPILSAAEIPVIVVGVRANRFTDQRAKTKALVWRVAPRAEAEAAAVARDLAQRWRDVPFGLVDDGSIHGRGLSDAVRSQVEAAGLRPATIDNYRPAEEKQFGLVRRIQASGVTHLFIAGDRPDIAIIARDAASLDLGLDIIGGETLLDEPTPDVSLPRGIHALAPRNRFEPDDFGTTAASAVRDGYFGLAHVAMEIAAAAVQKARAEARPVADVLNGETFATALGPVSFDDRGDSSLDLFQVFRFDGTDFVPLAGG